VFDPAASRPWRTHEDWPAPVARADITATSDQPCKGRLLRRSPPAVAGHTGAPSVTLDHNADSTPDHRCELKRTASSVPPLRQRERQTVCASDRRGHGVGMRPLEVADLREEGYRVSRISSAHGADAGDLVLGRRRLRSGGLGHRRVLAPAPAGASAAAPAGASTDNSADSAGIRLVSAVEIVVEPHCGEPGHRVDGLQQRAVLGG
jgi:hypothetical protein